MQMRSILCPAVFGACALLAAGCPAPDDDDDSGSSSTSSSSSGGSSSSGFCESTPAFTEDVSACHPLATDYQPRAAAPDHTTWPACISDDNLFHQINATISSIARVDAFEQIADLLWRGQVTPTADTFIDARVHYAADQGLDSRVQRRQDIHYPALTSGQTCNSAEVAAANPDRCAGPHKLLRVLNDAWAKGSLGEDVLVQAARIEASLLWFLYLSSLSEALSCAASIGDCDSQWAYYAGGAPRESPRGLGAYIDALGPQTHDRAYDASLAVRCWRDVDQAVPATNTALQDLALQQYDRALTRGMALILRQRFAMLSCSTGAPRGAAFSFIQTMAPWLDRAARAADPTAADALAAEVAKADPAAVNVAAAQSALDALFACP